MIDSHSHLNFPDFANDLSTVIKTAKSNGIDYFINIGAGLESTKASLELANSHPEIYTTVGIHPCNAGEWNKEVEEFFNTKLQSNPKIVAIGEIGIDYYRCKPDDPHPNHPKKTNRQIQHQAFRDQIQLSKKHQKPLVIHSRNANDTTWQDSESAAAEIWQILNEEQYFNCIFHCFAEDPEFAKQLWKQGIHISFNGTLTYPKNENLIKVAKHCPPDLYHLETDCPFLPPQSKRGQRNEPAYIKEFAQVIADIRNIPFEQVAQETTSNTQKFYNLPL